MTHNNSVQPLWLWAFVSICLLVTFHIIINNIAIQYYKLFYLCAIIIVVFIHILNFRVNSIAIPLHRKPSSESWAALFFSNCSYLLPKNFFYGR